MNRDSPQKLWPFEFHGLELSHPRANGESLAECPFCEGKFSVQSTTGQWRCWGCGKSGNVWIFLREFHGLCIEATSVDEYVDFAHDRSLLGPQPLIEWGVCKSLLKDDWIVPGYNPQGSVTGLYRYISQPDGSRRLIPTPTLGHHLHGMNTYHKDKPIVNICEGPWDGIVLWELFTRFKNQDNALVETASREISLSSQNSVLAVPGCEVFFNSWLPLLHEKIVNLLYYSDHPRKNKTTGKQTPGGGYRGMERLVRMITNSRFEPQEVNCIKWGPEGYDPSKKSGFDVRDYLTK